VIPRPNAVRNLVALVALTACAGRAAREEPTRFERPVGAVTVDGFAVQVTVVASSRRLGVIRGGSREAVRFQGPAMVWTIVAETQARTDGAHGPLGRILSCSFETDRLTVADVRAAVNGLQFRAEATPDGRAALTRVAVAALALDECLDSALAVLESIPEVDASAAVRKAIERFVSDPKRKLTMSFDHLIEFAKKRAVPDRATALMAALEASKTPARARSLAESIVAAGATPIDARFLAWVDALDKSDKRRAELSAARTAVRRRAPKG